MTSLIAWAAVTAALGGAVAATLAVGDRVRPGEPWAGVRRRLAAALACLVLVLALTAVLRLRPVAELDGAVVELLARSRSGALTEVMTYLTMLGDAVPTFVLATALALVVHRRGVHRAAGWLLPVLVLVELLAQVGLGAVIGPLSIAEVAPEIVLGGEGYLPSGSMARLGVLTLGGAFLLRPTAPRGPEAVAVAGGVCLLLEAVTRLYLGRHLGLDLVGGLLLGLALFLVLTLAVPDRAADPA